MTFTNFKKMWSVKKCKLWNRLFFAMKLCFKKWRLTTAIFLPSPEERSAAITTTLPNAAVNNCPRSTGLSRQKVNCKSNCTIKYHTIKKVKDVITIITYYKFNECHKCISCQFYLKTDSNFTASYICCPSSFLPHP